MRKILLFCVAFGFLSAVASAQECVAYFDESENMKITEGQLALEDRGGDQMFVVGQLGLILYDEVREFRKELVDNLGRDFEIWLWKAQVPKQFPISMNITLQDLQRAKPEWQSIEVYRMTSRRGQALGLSKCASEFLRENRKLSLSIVFKPIGGE